MKIYIWHSNDKMTDNLQDMVKLRVAVLLFLGHGDTDIKIRLKEETFTPKLTSGDI